MNGSELEGRQMWKTCSGGKGRNWSVWY